MKPTKGPETFGAKVARLREERSLSRYALAKKTGITQAGLAKVEQDGTQPTWDTVQKLALALGVSCSEFVNPALALPVEQPPKPRGRPKKAEAPPADAPPPEPARKPRAKEGGAERPPTSRLRRMARCSPSCRGWVAPRWRFCWP